MLKEFRSIDVYWDKATRRIYEEIRSSSSDEKGRKLTVQIVNDGQIQDLTNVALNLYWEAQDGENRGLDPFEPLDAENGIYELYFRTGMLEHVGKLNAHLHLVDTTGAITSEPFTIFVFEGVDVDAMASDDELSALNRALIEVQNVKQAEVERVESEEQRAIAEQERIENEQVRATNEGERVNAESTRTNAETNRASAETARVNAEQARATAETERVTAESARVSAEEEREQGYPVLDGRITAVEQNIELLNFSDSLTTITGVTKLTALKVGRLHMITFKYKPDKTGFTIGVITGIPAEYRPANSISGSVSTETSTSDSPLGISTVLRVTGVINVVAPSVPNYDMTFSFVWIA